MEYLVNVTVNVDDVKSQIVSAINAGVKDIKRNGETLEFKVQVANEAELEKKFGHLEYTAKVIPEMDEKSLSVLTDNLEKAVTVKAQVDMDGFEKSMKKAEKMAHDLFDNIFEGGQAQANSFIKSLFDSLEKNFDDSGRYVSSLISGLTALSNLPKGMLSNINSSDLNKLTDIFDKAEKTDILAANTQRLLAEGSTNEGAISMSRGGYELLKGQTNKALSELADSLMERGQASGKPILLPTVEPPKEVIKAQTKVSENQNKASDKLLEASKNLINSSDNGKGDSGKSEQTPESIGTTRQPIVVPDKTTSGRVMTPDEKRIIGDYYKSQQGKTAIIDTNDERFSAKDVYSVYGKEFLKEILSGLDVDQLRQITKQSGMANGPYSSSWKDTSKYIDHIIESAESKMDWSLGLWYGNTYDNDILDEIRRENAQIAREQMKVSQSSIPPKVSVTDVGGEKKPEVVVSDKSGTTTKTPKTSSSNESASMNFTVNGTDYGQIYEEKGEQGIANALSGLTTAELIPIGKAMGVKNLRPNYKPGTVISKIASQIASSRVGTSSRNQNTEDTTPPSVSTTTPSETPATVEGSDTSSKNKPQDVVIKKDETVQQNPDGKTVTPVVEENKNKEPQDVSLVKDDTQPKSQIPTSTSTKKFDAIKAYRTLGPEGFRQALDQQFATTEDMYEAMKENGFAGKGITKKTSRQKMTDAFVTRTESKANMGNVFYNYEDDKPLKVEAVNQPKVETNTKGEEITPVKVVEDESKVQEPKSEAPSSDPVTVSPDNKLQETIADTGKAIVESTSSVISGNEGTGTNAPAQSNVHRYKSRGLDYFTKGFLSADYYSNIPANIASKLIEDMWTTWEKIPADRRETPKYQTFYQKALDESSLYYMRMVDAYGDNVKANLGVMGQKYFQEITDNYADVERAHARGYSKVVSKLEEYDSYRGFESEIAKGENNTSDISNDLATIAKQEKENREAQAQEQARLKQQQRQEALQKRLTEIPEEINKAISENPTQIYSENGKLRKNIGQIEDYTVTPDMARGRIEELLGKVEELPDTTGMDVGERRKVENQRNNLLQSASAYMERLRLQEGENFKLGEKGIEYYSEMKKMLSGVTDDGKDSLSSMVRSIRLDEVEAGASANLDSTPKLLTAIRNNPWLNSKNTSSLKNAVESIEFDENPKTYEVGLEEAAKRISLINDIIENAENDTDSFWKYNSKTDDFDQVGSYDFTALKDMRATYLARYRELGGSDKALVKDDRDKYFLKEMQQDYDNLWESQRDNVIDTISAVEDASNEQLEKIQSEVPKIKKSSKKVTQKESTTNPAIEQKANVNTNTALNAESYNVTAEKAVEGLIQAVDAVNNTKITDTLGTLVANTKMLGFNERARALGVTDEQLITAGLDEDDIGLIQDTREEYIATQTGVQNMLTTVAQLPVSQPTPPVVEPENLNVNVPGNVSVNASGNVEVEAPKGSEVSVTSGSSESTSTLSVSPSNIPPSESLRSNDLHKPDALTDNANKQSIYVGKANVDIDEAKNTTIGDGVVEAKNLEVQLATPRQSESLIGSEIKAMMATDGQQNYRDVLNQEIQRVNEERIALRDAQERNRQNNQSQRANKNQRRDGNVLNAINEGKTLDEIQKAANVRDQKQLQDIVTKIASREENQSNRFVQEFSRLLADANSGRITGLSKAWNDYNEEQADLQDYKEQQRFSNSLDFRKEYSFWPTQASKYLKDVMSAGSLQDMLDKGYTIDSLPEYHRWAVDNGLLTNTSVFGNTTKELNQFINRFGSLATSLSRGSDTVQSFDQQWSEFLDLNKQFNRVTGSETIPTANQISDEFAVNRAIGSIPVKETPTTNIPSTPTQPTASTSTPSGDTVIEQKGKNGVTVNAKDSDVTVDTGNSKIKSSWVPNANIFEAGAANYTKRNENGEKIGSISVDSLNVANAKHQGVSSNTPVTIMGNEGPIVVKNAIVQSDGDTTIESKKTTAVGSESSATGNISYVSPSVPKNQEKANDAMINALGGDSGESKQANINTESVIVNGPSSSSDNTIPPSGGGGGGGTPPSGKKNTTPPGGGGGGGGGNSSKEWDPSEPISDAELRRYVANVQKYQKAQIEFANNQLFDENGNIIGSSAKADMARVTMGLYEDEIAKTKNKINLRQGASNLSAAESQVMAYEDTIRDYPIQEATKAISNYNKIQKQTQELAERANADNAPKALLDWYSTQRDGLFRFQEEYERDINTLSNPTETQVKGLAELGNEISRQYSEALADSFKQPINENTKSKMQSSFSAWLKNNPKAYSMYGDDIEKIYARLYTDDSKGLQQQTAGWINNLKTVADQTGYTGKSFTQELTSMGSGLMNYAKSYMSAYRVVGWLKQGVSTVKDLDSAYMTLRQTSSESQETLRAYQQESFGMADEVGTSAVQIQQSTADWLRLGKTFNQAKDYAKLSTKLLNVSEYSNINDATSALVSATQAYQDVDANDIVDRLSYVGNNFAVSTSDLATGLATAGGVLSQQGNSLEESIALLTAGIIARI